MGKGCGLKAVEAAKVGRRRRNQSYPQEDELSALLLCLLQFCYFKAFLEACQLLLCHLLHFFPMFEISKKKKRKTFLFFFSCFSFPPSGSWQSQQCQFTSGRNRSSPSPAGWSQTPAESEHQQPGFGEVLQEGHSVVVF